MEIVYHGHSWFQVNADGIVVHIDPLSERYRKRMGVELKPEMEMKADIVAISHAHGDHYDRGTIASLAGKEALIICPDKLAERLGGGVRAIASGQSIDHKRMTIKAVPSYNVRKPFHRRGRGVGYLLTASGKTVYHAGDTDLIPEMSSLGRVNLALLPIGGMFTMGVEEAVLAARRISPDMVVPMHTRSKDPMEMKRLLENDPKIEVVIMRPGERLTLG